MRVTGWTEAELRSQRASVIRAHFARIFVVLAWDPELAASVARPLPDRAAFGNISDYAAARQARERARVALETISAALWPEDDDRG
jgi:hypothetical protein